METVDIIDITSRNAPGYTMLYKGVDQGRIHSLFDESGNLANLQVLRSPSRTDFSGSAELFSCTGAHANLLTECYLVRSVQGNKLVPIKSWLPFGSLFQSVQWLHLKREMINKKNNPTINGDIGGRGDWIRVDRPPLSIKDLATL